MSDQSSMAGYRRHAEALALAGMVLLFLSVTVTVYALSGLLGAAP